MTAFSQTSRETSVKKAVWSANSVIAMKIVRNGWSPRESSLIQEIVSRIAVSDDQITLPMIPIVHDILGSSVGQE